MSMEFKLWGADAAVILRAGGKCEAVIPIYESDPPETVVMASLLVQLMQQENGDLLDTLVERATRQLREPH